MKKLIVVLLALLLPASAFAADVCVQGGIAKFNEVTSRIIVTCTADAAPGPFSLELDLNGVEGNWLYEVRTYPGTTNPSANSDLAITDENGMDILGGGGANKINAAEDLRFFPLNTSGNPAYWPVTDTSPTLAVTNNAVANAVFYIELIFAE